MPYVYDSETFPNVYLLNVLETTTNSRHAFEISYTLDQTRALRDFLAVVWASHEPMVGFNNLQFDYPVLHFILSSGTNDPMRIYQHAMAVLAAQDDDKWRFMVKPSERLVPQIDLFKIHHFDNKARMTSLKAIEFNMRLPNVSDLPFDVGTMLSASQIKTLCDYCWDDVEATAAFLDASKDKIDFRTTMSGKYRYDFSNSSDVKIGKQVFQIELEKAGVNCYDYHPETGRSPRQTPRAQIALKDCIPGYVKFESHEFESIRARIAASVITQTKGAFDDLETVYRGLKFKFGTGGIHASVESKSYQSSCEYMIYDIDVTSLYPSIAIENSYYPEHLGPAFVEVYRQLRARRVAFPKGSPENAALKLALNGVYGDSNSPFSIFYDPQFTMNITITGQMDMAMLVEQIMTVPEVEIIQANTDGITLYLPRRLKASVDMVCAFWESMTRLSLERVEYRKMFIADVNSYIAEDMVGKVKRKGRYEHDVEWHQNASALVVPKVAEQVLLHGAEIRKSVETWPDMFDFMLRVKVPRSSRLMGTMGDGSAVRLPNLCRYYVSKGGSSLIKIMPPLPRNPGVERHISVQSGYTVCPCNDVMTATKPIDFDYYVNEVEKLVLGVL